MELSGALYSVSLKGVWELVQEPDSDFWTEKNGDTLSVSVFSAPVAQDPSFASRVLEDASQLLELAQDAGRVALPEGSDFGAVRQVDEEGVFLAYAEARTQFRNIATVVMAPLVPVDGSALIGVLTVDTRTGSDLVRDVLETLALGATP